MSQFTTDSRRLDPDDPAWSPFRASCYAAMTSPLFEMAVAATVVVSFVCMVVETDSGESIPGWISVANWTILGLYVLEFLFKIYVYRAQFFCEACNAIDLAVIVVDLTLQILQLYELQTIPSVAPLRILRMLKLFRGYTIVAKFPQLSLMVKGLVGAMSVACYGVLLLFVVMTVFSVCAVHFVHPVNERVNAMGIHDNCPRCQEAFASVRSSMLTLVQQIIAGDSWGVVSIPIIEEEPWTSVYFGTVFVTVNVMIMNVILAVIVDAALKARQDDVSEVVRHKADQFKSLAKKLQALYYEMDTDGDGQLTQQELLAGFKSLGEFRGMMKSMDIHEEDMHVVFSILDSDESGSVSYEEFVTELFKLKAHDAHTMLVIIKYWVNEIRKDMRIQVKVAKQDIIQKIKVAEQMHSRYSEQEEGVPLCVHTSVSGNPSPLTLLEEKVRKSQGEMLHDLGEEMRNLRQAISEDSEDLVRSMKELSRVTETHKSLLSSAVECANAYQSTLQSRSSEADRGAKRPSPFQGHTSVDDRFAPSGPLQPVALSAAPSHTPPSSLVASGGFTPPQPTPSQKLPRKLRASVWGNATCCDMELHRSKDRLASNEASLISD